jgi:hypothetical protein
MADVSERHAIRIRGRDHTIVFIADSEDGRLVILDHSPMKSQLLRVRSRTKCDKSIVEACFRVCTR